MNNKPVIKEIPANNLYKNFVNAGLKFWHMALAFVTGLFIGQTEELKRCKACGLEKPLSDFYQHKGHKNLSSICKSCHIKKNKLPSQIFLERNPSYNVAMNKKHRKHKTELQRIYNHKKPKTKPVIT